MTWHKLLGSCLAGPPSPEGRSHEIPDRHAELQNLSSALATQNIHWMPSCTLTSKILKTEHPLWINKRLRRYKNNLKQSPSHSVLVWSNVSKIGTQMQPSDQGRVSLSNRTNGHSEGAELIGIGSKLSAENFGQWLTHFGAILSLTCPNRSGMSIIFSPQVFSNARSSFSLASRRLLVVRHFWFAYWLL